MSASLRLGKVAGVEIYVHATFFLLLAWVGIAHYVEARSIAAAAAGVLFLVAVFATVVLHELGHALAASRFGIRTRDITLLPIGGIARLDRIPEDPFEELIVALAGPAVNVAIAGALVGVAFLLGEPPVAEAGRLTAYPFLTKLIGTNVALVLFNILPAFPMDGGRVLRALLATRLGHERATEIAAAVGQGLALVFGVAGLLFNPLLILIAVFVWLLAGQEASAARIRAALAGIPVRQAMITEFQTLAPGDPLARAVEHTLAGFQQDFPVVDEGRLCGMLTRANLLEALARLGAHAEVREAMTRDLETATPSEPLQDAFQRIQECGCRSLPVTRNGALVGILTLENIGELLMIESASREGGEPAPSRRSAAPEGEAVGAPGGS